MAITNAGELIDAVTSWLARAPDAEDTVVVRIPDFIRLAEVRFYKRLRVPENMFRARAVINEPRERLPGQFHHIESLAFIENTSNGEGATRVLRYVSPHQFYAMFDTTIGDPYFYTLIGPEISFGPFIEFDATTPTANLGQIELVYFSAFPPLDTTLPTATNDVLLFYPDIYLFGSLVESQAYAAADQTMFQRWTAMYERAIEDANDVLDDAVVASASTNPSNPIVVV